jgi:hypothetical protein
MIKETGLDICEAHCSTQLKKNPGEDNTRKHPGG